MFLFKYRLAGTEKGLGFLQLCERTVLDGMAGQTCPSIAPPDVEWAFGLVSPFPATSQRSRTALLQVWQFGSWVGTWLVGGGLVGGLSAVAYCLKDVVSLYSV